MPVYISDTAPPSEWPISDDRRGAERFDQVGEVEHEVGDRVHAADRPGAVAVAAQVGRNDVPVVAQLARHPVPVARVIAAAVHEHQRSARTRCPNRRSAGAAAAKRRSARSGRRRFPCAYCYLCARAHRPRADQPHRRRPRAATAGSIEEAAAKAAAAGATLVVLPELALTGYPPMDLLERAASSRSAARAGGARARVASASRSRVGAVLPRERRGGKSLANAAVLLAGGARVAAQAKTLLPDLRRLRREALLRARRSSASAVRCSGRRAARPHRLRGRLGRRSIGYADRPDRRARARRARALVAEPLGVAVARRQGRERRRDVRARSRRATACRSSFVNQVGGNDELIFDGALVRRRRARARARVAAALRAGARGGRPRRAAAGARARGRRRARPARRSSRPGSCSASATTSASRSCRPAR